jgi:TP901 family phage tail tape measure protein
MFTNVLSKLGLAMSGQMGITGLATAAAIGLGAGVAAIGVAATKAASEYQTQFARISGLTGSSTENLKLYNEQLLKMSPMYDMTAASAAKALYFIISAGFQGQAALDVLKYSSMSATASLADQATVADALTSMMNGYKDANISASKAANDLNMWGHSGEILSSKAGEFGKPPNITTGSQKWTIPSGITTMTWGSV